MKRVISFIISNLFFIIAYAFVFSINVSAYIDPAVMTYTIQVGAGIVIAIGAVFGIYFRKIKKKMIDKLGIDENKNKEVESDDITIN